MYLKLLATSLLAIYSSVAFPQRHEIFSDEIRSLVVTANDDWQSLPVVELNNGKIDISFDDMTTGRHRNSSLRATTVRDLPATTSLRIYSSRS